MRSQLMSSYTELDEQWRERSQQMFRRYLKELDATKARRAWSAACQSEQRRLEWKSSCLQQEEKIRIFVAADAEIAPRSYRYDRLFQKYLNSSHQTESSSC